MSCIEVELMTQIKAAAGENVEIGGGTINYGTWVDHQPSGASVMHKGADGEMVTTLGDDLIKEMNFMACLSRVL